ncbi:MAG: hypothetical protein AAGD10_16200 [Myxococcota bacterium]
MGWVLQAPEAKDHQQNRNGGEAARHLQSVERALEQAETVRVVMRRRARAVHLFPR